MRNEGRNELGGDGAVDVDALHTAAALEWKGREPRGWNRGRGKTWSVQPGTSDEKWGGRAENREVGKGRG